MIGAMRAQVEPSHPMVVRMNAIDYADGDFTIEDAPVIGRTLGYLDVTALRVTSVTMCAWVAILPLFRRRFQSPPIPNRYLEYGKFPSCPPKALQWVKNSAEIFPASTAALSIANR